MVVLAIDTSHPTGSVTLSVDGVPAGSTSFEKPASHLVALAEAVERLLAARDLAPRAVTRLAVVTGPGSFTGLRIGLAFAKGLHAASGAEVVVIDSLRLLALPQLAAYDTACAMIDARRAEVYAAVFARAPGADPADPAAVCEVLAPRACAPDVLLDALAPVPAVFVGSGALACRALIGERHPRAVIADVASALPSTPYLAAIAHRLTALDRAAVRSLEPFYLRPSGAERMRRPPGGAA